MGLYEKDVHQYLTEYLAVNAGFCAVDARAIGREAQMLDNAGDPRNPTEDRSWSGAMMYGFHFPNEARMKELKRRALHACECGANVGAREIGEYIHALQDTYSHSVSRGDRNGQYYAWPVGRIGHFMWGHRPDWTWEDAEKANVMAERVFWELSELAKRCGGECTPNSWSAISGAVDKFNRFTPKSADFEVEVRLPGDITFYKVKPGGYDDKIKTLFP